MAHMLIARFECRWWFVIVTVFSVAACHQLRIATVFMATAVELDAEAAGSGLAQAVHTWR